jgi:hypothetical protein
MDKLVLVYYVNIGNIDDSDVEPYLNRVKDMLTDTNMVQYFIPVRDQETKIECINPKLVNEEEYQDVLNVLERQRLSYNNHLESLKRENEILRSEGSLNFNFE